MDETHLNDWSDGTLIDLKSVASRGTWVGKNRMGQVVRRRSEQQPIHPCAVGMFRTKAVLVPICVRSWCFQPFSRRQS